MSIILPDIAQITLPTGSVYNLKDNKARELIAELQANAKFLGVTTTVLTEGSTTNPIEINGEDVTARTGDWTICDDEKKEFIFNGTFWQEFGDMSDLGSLAYKNSASGSYTPSGTVSQPSFTGTEATVSVTGTPSGTVSQPSFIGNEATVNVSGTADAQVFTGSPVSYTPAGTNSGGAVTLNTTTVNSITDVGTLPSCTLPTTTLPTYTVANEVLTITAGSTTAGSFSAGTLPTKGEDTTVATSVESFTQPTFSGTAATITAEGTNSTSSVSASGTTTPSGTVSQPTFTGSELTSSGEYTPSGTVSQPTFTGTAATITVS